MQGVSNSTDYITLARQQPRLDFYGDILVSSTWYVFFMLAKFQIVLVVLTNKSSFPQPQKIEQTTIAVTIH